MKKSVLTRYRVMAYVTGVLLVLLTLGVFAKYALKLDGADSFTSVVGIAHGWLYVVYLVFAFDLGSKAKWPVSKQLWVLLMRHHPHGRVLRGAQGQPRTGGPARGADAGGRQGIAVTGCRRRAVPAAVPA